MSAHALMPLTVLLPLIGALAIVVTGSRPNLREAVTLITAVVLFVLTLGIAGAVLAGERPVWVLVDIVPGIGLGLAAEPLGALFACLASLLWIVTSVYAIGYMRSHHERNQTRFFAFFAVAIGCTMGAAYSANLVTLFSFYESLTLSTLPLVAHEGSKAARGAGRMYIGMLLGTSILFLLPAIVATWVATGSATFTPGGIFPGTASVGIIALLVALYLLGITKAAMMPFHHWLPAAMVAPTPVSALLHAVAVVKTGVFAIVKVIVYIFGVDRLAEIGASPWLAVVAGTTILVAATIALKQDNLKRRLAYSTISQLSYIVLAAAVLTPLSITGAALHIVAHAFGKITLFFCAGAILVAAHKTEVHELAGIGRRMPWTMSAFAIASLSMIGLPPTAGFVSKWYIFNSAWQAGATLPLLVLMVSTLLSAAYLLPIVYTAFFQAPAPLATHAVGAQVHDGAHSDHGEAPATMVVPILCTAIGTVALFAFPGVLLPLAEQLAEACR